MGSEICIRARRGSQSGGQSGSQSGGQSGSCLLYTTDAADEDDSVDLGGCRIIKKKSNTDCLESTFSR